VEPLPGQSDTNTDRPKFMPVCIAGMHRSGTSLLAQLLNRCGVYLGKQEDLLGPASDNQDGFWENVRFVKLNDEILHRLGGAWDLPPVFQNGWEKLPKLEPVTAAAKKLAAAFHGHEPWGWKDPRNSLTAGFWEQVLGPGNIRYIICLRNPLEVARSLQKRSGNSFAFSFNLWYTYNKAVLDRTKPEQRIITHYDALFIDPQQELQRLVDFLSLPAQRDAVNTACVKISRSLRHHAVTPDTLTKAGASKELVTLYEEMCAQAGPVYPHASSNSSLLREKPAAADQRTSGIVSLVILTYNQLRYTRECIESIEKHTPDPHEILFVDNGSTDGTVPWLRKLVEQNNNYTLIENGSNQGFARGCNQGMNAAIGEYILLLNNDVVVTKHWLSDMLACLNSAPDIGIVGPMTNSISGPQKVELAGYSSVAQLDACAQVFRERHRHRRIPMKRVVGFAMLFRRDLANKIGFLDESFGTGNFEDDDYCLRSALAGYRNMIAGDVFIHHYGSRSFIGNNIHYGSAMTGNKKIFNLKWGSIRADSALGRDLIIVQALEQAGGLLRRDQSEKALTTLIDAIKYSPHDERIYVNLANMLLEAKEFGQALDVIASMPPRDTDAQRLCIAGYCKEGLSSSDEASNLAARALSLQPGYAPALNLQGVIAYKREDRTLAESLFRKAAESDPGYGEPFTNLGVLRWSQGEHPAGLDLLEQGFLLAPLSRDAASLYHTAAATTGALMRAQTAFQEVYALYPDLRRACFLLIDIMLRQNKHEEALALTHAAMIAFGTDDGILAAALDIRNNLPVKKAGLRKKNPDSLTVCMIVKNEEAYLPKCLMSIKDLADEIIVVDTGSTDRTKAIALAFGAQAAEIPWTDDFSAARNASLERASCSWVLILDADEVVAPQDHAALKKLIRKTPKKPAAYSVVTRNYITAMNISGWTTNDGKYAAEEAGSGWNPSTKVRLFTNDPRIRFENRVHELVEASLARIGVTPQPCEIPIHHYGKLKEDKVMTKGEDYFLLGREKLRETRDPKALYELALQAGELDRFSDAIDLWEQFLRLPDLPQELVLKAYVNMGHAFVQTNRFDDAFSASRKAIELAPDSASAVINYGLSELWRGDIRKAVPFLEDLVKSTPGYPPAIGLLAIASLVAGQTEAAGLFFEQLKTQGFLCEPYLLNHAQKLIAADRAGLAAAILETAQTSGLGSAGMNTLLDECRNISANRSDPLRSA